MAYTIGEKLIELRNLMGLSITEVADRLELNRTIYKDLESDKLLPNLHTKGLLSEFFNVPFETFVSNSLTEFSNNSSYHIHLNSDNKKNLIYTEKDFDEIRLIINKLRINNNNK